MSSTDTKKSWCKRDIEKIAQKIAEEIVPPTPPTPTGIPEHEGVDPIIVESTDEKITISLDESKITTPAELNAVDDKVNWNRDMIEAIGEKQAYDDAEREAELLWINEARLDEDSREDAAIFQPNYKTFIRSTFTIDGLKVNERYFQKLVLEYFLRAQPADSQPQTHDENYKVYYVEIPLNNIVPPNGCLCKGSNFPIKLVTNLIADGVVDALADNPKYLIAKRQMLTSIKIDDHGDKWVQIDFSNAIVLSVDTVVSEYQTQYMNNFVIPSRIWGIHPVTLDEAAYKKTLRILEENPYTKKQHPIIKQRILNQYIKK